MTVRQSTIERASIVPSRSRPIAGRSCSAGPVAHTGVASLVIAGLAIVSMGLGGGCRSFPGFAPPAPISPVVFEKTPSRAEVIDAVNANAAPIRHLQADGISLSMASMPSLKGNLLVERPGRLRVTASLLGFGGAGVDAGLNEEYFFVWPTYTSPPTVYWARHDEFASSPIRGRLPLEPAFLVDALGLLTIDPTGQHEGPFFPRPGEIELISHLRTPSGMYRRVLVIDSKYGWITQQHYYDPSNRPILSVHSSAHRYYADSRVTLPMTHRIHLPTLPVTVTLEISNFRINTAVGETADSFAGPRPKGGEYINLVEHPEVLTGGQPMAGAAVGPTSAGATAVQKPRPAGDLIFRPDATGRSHLPADSGFATSGPSDATSQPTGSGWSSSTDPWGVAPLETLTTPPRLDAPASPTDPWGHATVSPPSSGRSTTPDSSRFPNNSGAPYDTASVPVGTRDRTPSPTGRGATLFESDEQLVAAIRRVLPLPRSVVRGQSPADGAPGTIAPGPSVAPTFSTPAVHPYSPDEDRSAGSGWR